MAGLQAVTAPHLGFGAALCPSFQGAVESRTTSVRAHGPVRVHSALRNPKRVVRVNSSGVSGAGGDSAAAPAAKKASSILCQSCDGNGVVSCSQCNGSGVNTEDHFNGRFKAGQMCWLCRGKRQMLCGNCNGAGFMGGFMNTPDE